MYPPAVLERSLPFLRPHGFAGDDVAEICETYVGETALPDGHGHCVQRNTCDRIRGTVYGVEYEGLVETVVHVPDLLAQDVQRNGVPHDVVEDCVLRHLVHLGGRSPVRPHLDILPHLLTGDEADRLGHGIRDGFQRLQHTFHTHVYRTVGF